MVLHKNIDVLYDHFYHIAQIHLDYPEATEL